MYLMLYKRQIEKLQKSKKYKREHYTVLGLAYIHLYLANISD